MHQATCPPESDLREDYMSGMAGNNLAQMFVGLQHHKRGLEQALRWAERANRIGWQNAGVDVAQLDKDANDQIEDMDSSINLSGDTHIHMVPNGGHQPQQPEPQPQPAPTPPPEQPATKPNGTPTWLKWALAAAIGAAGAGPPSTVWFLRQGDQQPAGGSIFRFDTELPPWMEETPE